MFKQLLGAVAIMLSGAAASAATYTPVGVQTNVAAGDVFGGGWSSIYTGNYNDSNIDLASIFANAGEHIMLAARRVGSDTFSLLATIDSALFVPLQTAHNQTLTANGAEWYKNGYSMGFAGLGDAITQNSADTNGTNAELRMSWHTNIEQGQDFNAAALTLSWGWRAGATTGLGFDGQWERLILTDAAVAPVPVPAALPLMLVGLGGFSVLARRRRKS